MYFAIPYLFFSSFPSSIRHIASITIIEVLAAIGLVVWAAGYRFIRVSLCLLLRHPGFDLIVLKYSKTQNLVEYVSNMEHLKR